MALHELAERLSVPRPETQAADFRAHQLVRPLLDDNDQRRRLLEDRFIAGPQATTNLADQLADVRRRYEATAGIEDALARGYQVRDRAWSELPYLISWSRSQGDWSGGRTSVDRDLGAGPAARAGRAS